MQAQEEIFHKVSDLSTTVQFTQKNAKLNIITEKIDKPYNGNNKKKNKEIQDKVLFILNHKQTFQMAKIKDGYIGIGQRKETAGCIKNQSKTFGKFQQIVKDNMESDFRKP